MAYQDRNALSGQLMGEAGSVGSGAEWQQKYANQNQIDQQDMDRRSRIQGGIAGGQAASVPVITARIEALGKTIAELTMMMDHMQQRLAPVCHPRDQSKGIDADGVAQTARAPNSDMAERLESLQYALALQVHRGRDILVWLQI